MKNTKNKQKSGQETKAKEVKKMETSTQPKGIKKGNYPEALGCCSGNSWFV